MAELLGDAGATSWALVTNATLNSGIIHQKKGVAYDKIQKVKYE